MSTIILGFFLALPNLMVQEIFGRIPGTLRGWFCNLPKTRPAKACEAFHDTMRIYDRLSARKTIGLSYVLLCRSSYSLIIASSAAFDRSILMRPFFRKALSLQRFLDSKRCLRLK